MGTVSYENFDLEIRREQDRYVAVARSGQAAAEEPFSLPFSAAELARFPPPAGRSRHLRPVADPAPAEQLTPAAFGRRLFGAVFHGAVRDCLVRCLALVEQRNSGAGEGTHGLRLRLQLARVPELALLPWEHLCGLTADPFALSAYTPIVRLVDSRVGPATLRVEPPLRILLMIANPGAALDAAGEWGGLRAALADLRAHNRVELDLLPEASLELLRDAFRRKEYHILHFIGHGGFDPQAQEGFLLLEEPVGAMSLAVQLYDRKPRLVFLNACQSGAGGAGSLLAGTAQRLIEHGIPAVVAMQAPISDRAAVALAQEFYRAVAEGYPVDAALADGRKALFASRQRPEWCTPALFSNAGDLRLLEVEPEQRRLPFEPETVVIPAGPFRMGSPDAADIARGDLPLHEVELPAYAIGRYPVTNAQYALFVQAQPDRRPRGFGWSFIRPPQHKANHPVVGITFDDACAYCRWLSQKTRRTYRLPGEAEWEKAARGDRDARRYPWGDELSGNYCAVAGHETTPVTAYPDGRSPYGCFDLVGNIYEWTCTPWEAAGDAAGNQYTCTTPPLEGDDVAPGRQQVCKGGPLQSGSARGGCSVRHRFAAHAKHASLGFRIVEQRSASSPERE